MMDQALKNIFSSMSRKTRTVAVFYMLVIAPLRLLISSDSGAAQVASRPKSKPSLKTDALLPACIWWYLFFSSSQWGWTGNVSSSLGHVFIRHTVFITIRQSYCRRTYSQHIFSHCHRRTSTGQLTTSHFEGNFPSISWTDSLAWTVLHNIWHRIWAKKNSRSTNHGGTMVLDSSANWFSTTSCWAQYSG